jgi:hypothetical protein
MRVRISFSNVTNGGAPIDPCATATYGETEDYLVNITAANGIDQLSASMISVYPNPTNDLLTIELGELANDTEQIEVLDITGKSVANLTHVDGHSASLSLHSLAKGMYQVVVVTHQGKITKQVIKN